MQNVQINRGTGPLTKVQPDDSSNQTKVVMGENAVRLNFHLNHYVNFLIGDWCDVYGERYNLNQTPIVEKQSQYDYKYSLVFQVEGADISKVQFLFLDPINTLTDSDFSFMGNPQKFMELLLTNVQRVLTGYSIGQVVPGDYKNLSFKGENCYNVLSRLAAEFDTEFWIEGKVLHLAKRSVDTALVFQQGRYKGLYEVVLKDFNNAAIITRLYAYGSTRNLPSTYNGDLLHLPSAVLSSGLVSSVTYTVSLNGDGTQTIVFTWNTPVGNPAAVSIEYRASSSIGNWQSNTGSHISPRSITIPTGNYDIRFITQGGAYAGQVTNPIAVTGVSSSVPALVGPPLPYIERNTAIYGIIEHTEFFEDVYPHRTGKVSSVNAANPFEFSDTGIDFDINAQLQPGLTAKVVFNTGQLSGYSFQISSYDATFKRLIILKNEEERNQTVPSASLKPAIGDEYVLIDIKMPQSYILKAENELLTKANALLATISEPQVSYSLTLDPVYLRLKAIALSIGNLIWLKDTNLNIQQKIRVTRTVRGIVNEQQYQVDLSHNVSPGAITRILAATSDNTRNINVIARDLGNNSVLNNEVIGTLRFGSMPQTSTVVGFEPVYIEIATGKLFRKV